MSKADDPRDEELSALYRSGADESPSGDLDARILAAARAAATPRRKALPASRPASWAQRWRIPVALAATVLMTATLTLLVREHAVDGVPLPAPRPQAVEANKEAAPAASAPVAPTVPAPTQAPERRSAAPARDAALGASAPAERAEKATQDERPARRGRLEPAPEQWLAEIRRLRSEGRTTEAAERLAELRKRYPDFPLPEDMRAP